MTTDPVEIGSTISHKHILLDTSVITRASDHPGAFRPFFELLISNECKPIITPLIKFEYLRGALSIEHKEKRQALINLINPDTLSSSYTEQRIDLAIEIANNYARNRLESPNVVDCSLAANVLNFRGNLFLATLNHKDFPTFLLDRVGVFTVATEKDVIPIGIYGYNMEKTSRLNLST